jgi:biotin carboxyl carrier protein
MEDSDKEKPDTRQLEKYRVHWRWVPGEVRLVYLEGRPPEFYVLTAWHIKVGDAVEVGQEIATIETPSFSLVMEAIESGVVTEIRFSIGDVIPEGAVIARIGSEM